MKKAFCQTGAVSKTGFVPVHGIFKDFVFKINEQVRAGAVYAGYASYVKDDMISIM